MFIQTEATPNPATMKFLPGRVVLESGTLDLRDKDEAAQSPLAERLFDIAGVNGVFFGSDFIAVTKNASEWQQLKPMILGAIMEHFMSGAPVLAGSGPKSENPNAGWTPTASSATHQNRLIDCNMFISSTLELYLVISGRSAPDIN